ncbi:alpha-glucosidase C-terminal domain-containing protein, partial [Rhizobium brockwellii]|uniref:alpha-glucosidase C-terminal domain-containing protein n=1 Tax=Rhizobium brockwellii TaxID=3019932 RepID=UPI003F9A8DF0
RLRADTPALAVGDLTLLHADEQLLAFERREGEQRLLCLFNLGDTPVTLPPALPRGGRVLVHINSATDERLGAFGAAIREMT